MKTYLEKSTNKWISYKPESYWSGMTDIYGKKIYLGDVYQVLNANGCDKPVIITCDEYCCITGNTYYSSSILKYKKIEK